MSDHWELLDLVKALLSLGAGMLLGLERELKDKAAGLKTITIICLGSTLFSIVSYKIGGLEDTRIASYIVGGIGFIGAGVIFRNGINVSGLTTAGIIWFSAAVGMSIGFGEFFLALTFLATALLMIFFGSHINRIFKNRTQTRRLEFEIRKSDLLQKEIILSDIRKEKILIKEDIFEVKDESIKIIAEIVVNETRIAWLQNYLLHHKHIHSFSI